MSVLDGLPARAGWERAPFGRLVTRSKAAGRPDLPSLSVYLEDGVVPRSSREDNHNRLGEDATKYLVVLPGDVVFNKLRTWQGGLGVSRYEGIVSPAYYVCRPQPSMEPRFLHYLLRSKPYLAELTRVSKFMPPSQFDILWDDLRDVPVAYPALGEQRRIADYLDTETARIDATIAAKSRLSGLVGERTAARISAVLDKSGGDLVRLSYFVTSLTQGSSPQAGGRPAGPGEWGLLKLSAVKAGAFQPYENKVVSPADIANPLHPQRGDLLVTRANTPVYVGDACAVTEDHPDLAICDLIYRLRLTSKLNSEFAALCLLQPKTRSELTSAARGTSQSMVKLRGEDIRAIRIPVPSLDAQLAVVAETRRIRERGNRIQARLQQQVSLLREHRQTLITAAVTGELEIPGVA